MSHPDRNPRLRPRLTSTLGPLNMATKFDPEKAENLIEVYIWLEVECYLMEAGFQIEKQFVYCDLRFRIHPDQSTPLLKIRGQSCRTGSGEFKSRV